MQTLDIIHENADYIVVNKQAGLISERSIYEACTVEAQVWEHLSKQSKKPYVGVIHRLDRVTSGVLIFAKKKRVLVQFNELFSSREIQKTYVALVHNTPEHTQQRLVNFLVKNNLEKRADIVATKTKEALDCSLTYKVMGHNAHGTLLEVQPQTGRFHQIRAQLAHIGLPIIGDDKYGSDQPYLPLCVCLHAWKLTFKVPGSKDMTTYEAPLPRGEFWKVG